MNTYQGKSRRTTSNGSNIVTQLGRALAGIWNLFVKQRGPSLNRSGLLAQFAEIERLVQGNDEIHAAQAVVRADSLLDTIMRQVGGQGATFADRLRSLQPKLSGDTYQDMWDAHKLRNAIAHEHPTISVTQARGALQAFRRGASQLGAF